jgi:5-amino-6-(5-phosphoribosylamino)uracil reductase
MSLDGYVSGPTPGRLVLSGEADFDRVDTVRASCDAILVGAETIRRDDPRLLVRAEERRSRRVSCGLPPSPTKVTLTSEGKLDPAAQFFTAGDTDRLVYCGSSAFDDVVARLGQVATVVDAGQPTDLTRIVEDLHGRGVRRLMVEGGQTLHTQFLTAGLADELHLVVAPFFVGDTRARRFVGDGAFPWHAKSRARLVEARPVGDVVLLRYALSERFTEE